MGRKMNWDQATLIDKSRREVDAGAQRLDFRADRYLAAVDERVAAAAQKKQGKKKAKRASR
jgi:hypothetical protein